MKIHTIRGDADEQPDLYVGNGQKVEGNNSGRVSNNPMIQDLMANAEQRAPNEREAVVREFTIYRNGFLLHKTFYTHDSEEGKQILQTLKSGHAPLSLLDVQQNDEVDLKAFQKLDEDYVPPFEPFKGSGNRLGAPVNASRPPPTETPVVEEELPKLDPKDPDNMTLQIRKSNGERTSVVCKRSSTVAQLNAQMQGTLFHSFPRKQVDSLTGCEKEVLLLI